MEEPQYGVIKPVFEPRTLIIVPHKGNPLVVSQFGPNHYETNVIEMQRADYSCLNNFPQISFREPLTSESISACAYDFEKRAKPQILDPRFLQLGRILKTQDGVFTNPRDKQGKRTNNKETLKSLLKGAEKIKIGSGHIYLCKSGMAFAESNTFRQGEQDSKTFTRSGLAKALEHTEEEIAGNLRKISSPKMYNRGVKVSGFDLTQESREAIATLTSDKGYSGSDSLSLDDHSQRDVKPRSDLEMALEFIEKSEKQRKEFIKKSKKQRKSRKPTKRPSAPASDKSCSSSDILRVEGHSWKSSRGHTHGVAEKLTIYTLRANIRGFDLQKLAERTVTLSPDIDSQ